MIGLMISFGATQADSAGKPSSGPGGKVQSESPTENLHDQIDDLEVQIQKLREQSIELQEKTRLKLKAQIEYLQKQRDSLVPRIEKLRDNSETAWQDIKENIQKAIEELKKSADVMEK
ncbi:MAG: hypothetical protein AB7T38_09210 [Nitrospirales bacterium]